MTLMGHIIEVFTVLFYVAILAIVACIVIGVWGIESASLATLAVKIGITAAVTAGISFVVVKGLEADGY